MLVIVPDLPPNINGLGDYAILLANQIRVHDASFKIDFLVAGNISYSFKELDGFKVYTLTKKKSTALYSILEFVDPKLIHLHYVGYGYEKRGAPLWLYFGLLKWKQKKGNVLISTFHELFAISNNLLTSSFWNQWLQKRICKKIYLLSKCVVTTRESFRKVLFRYSPFIDIYVFPVFSNFGELKEYPNFRLRDKSLIVLGSSENRSYLFKKFQNELNIFCEKYSIHRIIDIGPRFENLPLLNAPIIQLGILNSKDISFFLEKCLFGIIASHTSNNFAKSGVFAAYAAHGVIVIALKEDVSKIEDGIIPNQHFISINSSDVRFSNISLAIFEWYNDHSLEKQALSYIRIFNI